MAISEASSGTPQPSPTKHFRRALNSKLRQMSRIIINPKSRHSLRATSCSFSKVHAQNPINPESLHPSMLPKNAALNDDGSGPPSRRRSGKLLDSSRCGRCLGLLARTLPYRNPEVRIGVRVPGLVLVFGSSGVWYRTGMHNQHTNSSLHAGPDIQWVSQPPRR